MTDTGIGALGYVGFKKETVEGTAESPAKFLAVTSATFDDTNEYLTPLQIRGNRDISVAMQAPNNTSGSIELALPPDDIALWLEEAFAATYLTSAYAGGGYTHVFTPGNSSYTATVTTSHQDVLVKQYAGMRVNTFELRATFGEIVNATLGLSGLSVATTGSTFTPTYAASSVTPFHFTGSTVSIGGSPSTLVKDFTFGVNNNVSMIGTLRATRNYARVALGPREVTLSMSLDFTDTTEYTRFANDTEFAVSLYFEAGTITSGTGKNSLTIALPRVKYRRVGMPLNAPDFLTQDVECTVLKPNSSTAIATVTLVNAEPTVT